MNTNNVSVSRESLRAQFEEWARGEGMSVEGARWIADPWNPRRHYYFDKDTEHAWNIFKRGVEAALAQPSEQPAKCVRCHDEPTFDMCPVCGKERKFPDEQPGDVGLYEAANGALSMLGYLLNHLPEGSRDNTAYMNLREELKSRGALRHGL